MKTKILIIDDDRNLLDALSLTLEEQGYAVLTATNGGDGYQQIGKEFPDLVIADINMPVMDGLTLCKKIRDENKPVPFIILTSRDSEIDQALGLNLGADDYVIKPFSTQILLARLQAILRRNQARSSKSESNSIRKIGKTMLDLERMEVTCNGKPITVTVSEFRLLEALIANAGIVLSRDKLMDLMRDDDSIVYDRIIDTYIRRLRRKLEAADPSFNAIETIIGAGYRWKAR
jgi:DNA-binding response OmpR family regulator